MVARAKDKSRELLSKSTRLSATNLSKLKKGKGKSVVAGASPGGPVIMSCQQ
jgi:DNA-binding Xre family transcriptional regulator